MTATEYVVLVDNNDREIGLAEKLDAHRRCLLHRAFSIFLFSGEKLLLQQRALHKYHSAGLWTNTCCSHPRSGENLISAGKRRLQEELGITAELKDIGWFQYIAHFENGLAENELDHVLVGFIPSNMVITPNPDEVNALRWVSIEDLDKELASLPEQFTPWLKQALEIVKNGKK